MSRSVLSKARTTGAAAAMAGHVRPIGRHRYFFKLYALDAMLPADKPLTKHALEAAMQGHIVAQAELIGTYQKGG